MPLDPSIPLSVKPIQLPDPLEMFSAIEQVKGQREAAELRRLAAEEARQRGIEAREARAEKKQLAELYAEAVTVDPVNGQIRYNREKLVAQATQQGYKHLVPTLLDQLQKDEAEMNTLIKSGLDVDNARRVWLAGEASDVIQAQGNPEVWKTTVLRARQTNAIDQATYDREVALTDPAQILARARGWVTRAAGKPGEGFTLNPGDVRYDPSGKVIARGDPRTAPPPAIGSFEDYVIRRFGAQPTAPQIAQAHRDWQPPPLIPLQLVSVLDPSGKPVLVPESEAVGKTPGSAAADAATGKLPAAIQAEIATMLTAEQMANDVAKLGAETNWAGVGPWEGRVGASPLGSGGAKGETLRNQIGNIQATIALMRGGTSFTDTEKALLETYTPTTTDTDAKIKTKLTNLVDFIQKKRANVLRVAGGEYTLPPESDPLTVKAPNGVTYTFKTAAEAAAFKKRAGIQ